MQANSIAAAALHLEVRRGREGAVSSVGRLDRQKAQAVQCNIPLPQDLRDRVEGLVAGGSTAGAYLALLLFAVDTVEREGLSITLRFDP